MSRAYPVDTSRLTLIAGSDPAAVLDMERRPRAGESDLREDRCDASRST